MLLTILLLLFLSVSGCSPQSASPALSPPPVVTPQPLQKIPSSTPFLQSPSPAPVLFTPAPVTPDPAPAPVFYPSPGPGISSPSGDNREDAVPASTDSPASTLAQPSPFPALSSPLTAEIPLDYRGKKNPYPWNDAKTKESGKTIFNELCQGCHGTAGNLEKNADFSSPQMSSRIKDSPEYFFWRVSEGKKTASGFNMPAFKELLKEEERWQVLIYIQDLGSR